MRLTTSFLTAVAAAAAARAHMLPRAEAELSRCAAPEPTEEQLEAARLMAIEEQARKESGQITARATISVDTVFHVVAASEELDDGYVTDEMLSDQLDVMNDNYAPYGISFSLVNTTRTINSNWANDGAELQMKKALRQGDYATLNLYFQKDIGGYLGYCYFPTSTTEGSNDFYYDGCSILYSSLPGGSSTNYNLGKTVTHEVGHWFGLYHTFQGGCSELLGGDRIADTPAQASASSGCPEGRDSCPNKDGLDPIHNYMDYSYDSCYEEFTDDQETRIYSMWDTYRA